MTSPATIDRLRVGTPQGGSGLLAKTNEGYLFGYHADAPKAAEISLLMPHRLEQYASRELHPIFQMNLPEGYVLERLRQRLAKATTIDPMLLLAADRSRCGDRTGPCRGTPRTRRGPGTR